jgi:cation:H+ antiporter
VSALVAPQGITVSAVALNFDIPIMIAVAVACLPIFFTGHLIARWEGFLFLGYYILYILYLVLSARHYPALPAVDAVITYFIIPVTLVILVISVIQSIRATTPVKT